MKIVRRHQGLHLTPILFTLLHPPSGKKIRSNTIMKIYITQMRNEILLLKVSQWKLKDPELPLEDKSKFKLNLPSKAHKQRIKTLFVTKPK